MDRTPESVYVVAGETRSVGRDRILHVFDKAEAANAYVNDPDNIGDLYVEEMALESEYGGS